MRIRKLAAAVMAATLTGPAPAQADSLTVYGSLGAALESLDNDLDSTLEVSNTHSALGIKGDVTINERLRGVYLFDMFLGIDDSVSGASGSLLGGGRDGYVGVDGEQWGTVALGYHGRPWKTSTHHLDLFSDTVADYSAIMGSTGDANTYFDGGIGNGVIWFGPRVNGVSWQLQYGADENDDGSNDSGGQVNYNDGPVYLSLSVDQDGRAGGGDVSATKVAGSYDLGAEATLVGIYETISDGDTNSRDAWYLGGAYNVSHRTAVKLAVAGADDLDAGSDTGATYWAAGVSHRLAPEVELYGLVAGVGNDSNASYTFVSSPHTSSNGNTAIASAGDGSTVVAVGARVHFAITHHLGR